MTAVLPIERRRPTRSRGSGAQPASRVVDVEREAVDGEVALEAGQLVEGPVEASRRRGGGRPSRAGGRGTAGRAASGPRRTEPASCSQPEMPSATITNTTGETGRKVPVPRRWMPEGGVGLGRLGQVLLDGRHVGLVDLERRHQRDVGGDARRRRVAEAARGSSCSCSPQGSGTAMATPIVRRHGATLAARGGRPAADEPDPVVDVGQRALGHGAAPSRPRRGGSRRARAVSSSSSSVRSRNGVTNSTTTSARSFLRSP